MEQGSVTVYVVLKSISDTALYRKGWPASALILGRIPRSGSPGWESEKVWNVPCCQMFSQLPHLSGIWTGSVGTEVVSPGERHCQGLSGQSNESGDVLSRLTV